MYKNLSPRFDRPRVAQCYHRRMGYDFAMNIKGRLTSLTLLSKVSLDTRLAAVPGSLSSSPSVSVHRKNGLRLQEDLSFETYPSLPHQRRRALRAGPFPHQVSPTLELSRCEGRSFMIGIDSGDLT